MRMIDNDEVGLLYLELHIPELHIQECAGSLLPE